MNTYKIKADEQNKIRIYNSETDTFIDIYCSSIEQAKKYIRVLEARKYLWVRLKHRSY
jgi:hypothetical protein